MPADVILFEHTVEIPPAAQRATLRLTLRDNAIIPDIAFDDQDSPIALTLSVLMDDPAQRAQLRELLAGATVVIRPQV